MKCRTTEGAISKRIRQMKTRTRSASKRARGGVRRVPRIAQRYAQAVRAGLAPGVQSIVLFGSRARGDARPGSDYDFLVVLDRADRKSRDKVSEAGAELLNATDRLCAAVVYAPEQWEQVRQSPLGWNIAREGIVL